MWLWWRQHSCCWQARVVTEFKQKYRNRTHIACLCSIFLDNSRLDVVLNCCIIFGQRSCRSKFLERCGYISQNQRFPVSIFRELMWSAVRSRPQNRFTFNWIPPSEQNGHLPIVSRHFHGISPTHFPTVGLVFRYPPSRTAISGGQLHYHPRNSLPSLVFWYTIIMPIFLMWGLL